MDLKLVSHQAASVSPAHDLMQCHCLPINVALSAAKAPLPAHPRRGVCQSQPAVADGMPSFSAYLAQNLLP